ncbi:MAG: hypothetical protein Q7T59_02595 [Candidatus Woesebacteria bacterium]|nr:hypothetical protein [Candidatus Woesebacteria bacterium]
MMNLQQQKIAIDQQAQKTKDEADKTAVYERQKAADEETAKIRQEAEDEVSKIQYNAQK